MAAKKKKIVSKTVKGVHGKKSKIDTRPVKGVNKSERSPGLLAAKMRDTAKKTAPVLKIRTGPAPAMLNHRPENDAPAIKHGGPAVKIVETKKPRFAKDVEKTIAEITESSGHAPTRYQRAVFEFVADHTKGHGLVSAVAGSGKCLGRGTPVLMFDGSIKSVEDIEQGDMVMGPDSEPRTVLSSCSGTDRLFKITPVKGAAWVCNSVHMLTLVNSVTSEVFDIPLNEYLRDSGSRRLADAKLFRVGVNFPKQEVPVDPYLAGLWIGDGTRGEAAITNSDHQIVGYCQQVADDLNYRLDVRWIEKNHTNTISFRVGARGETFRGQHALRSAFRHQFQDAKGRKIVPTCYLHNSREVRAALLAGWLDTDGSYANGHFDIVMKGRQLRDAFLYLARSLGLAAYASKKVATIKSIGFTGTYWRISLSGDLTCLPCKVHNIKPRLQKKSVLRTGFSVEPCGRGDYFGFTLDGDGRFLLGDFTVTHNTTTLMQALEFIPFTHTVLMCAFNKHIADELNARGLPDNVIAATLNSFGFRALNASVAGRKTLDKDKTENCLYYSPKMFNRPEKDSDELKKYLAVRSAVCRLVSLLKAHAVGCPGIEGVPELSVDTINDLALKFGVDIPAGYDDFHDITMRAFTLCTERTDLIDYDDQLYLPLKMSLPIPKYDFVFVDESQDLNICQIELVRRAAKRAVFVGDPGQAIYGFRGANPEAIDFIREKFGATELPLSICWRCPKAVVAEAKAIVPHIEPAPNAKDGLVRRIKIDNLTDVVASGEYVLCRTTAPLVQECLAVIRAGKKAIVRGRDIGRSLLAALERVEKAGSSGSPGERIAAWGFSELEKLSDAHKPEAMISKLQDQIDTLQALAIGCPDMLCVRTKIDKVFSDEDTGTVFSTIHKAKGLEADRVYIIRPDLLPHPMAEQPWEKTQEDNLKYVAITRAMKELVWVDGESSKKAKAAKTEAESPMALGVPAVGAEAKAVMGPSAGSVCDSDDEAEMRRMEAHADREQTIRDETSKMVARKGR